MEEAPPVNVTIGGEGREEAPLVNVTIGGEGMEEALLTVLIALRFLVRAEKRGRDGVSCKSRLGDGASSTTSSSE